MERGLDGCRNKQGECRTIHVIVVLGDLGNDVSKERMRAESQAGSLRGVET